MALEGVLSTVAGGILNVIGSQAFECFGMLWGLNAELKNIESNVSSIRAVLLQAEELQNKIKDDDRPLNNWLEKLGDVLYDVEDVLDEIPAEVLRRNAMTKGKIAKQVRIFFSNSNQLAFNYRIACQVKEVSARLEVISKEKKDFHFDNNAKVEARMQNNLFRPTEVNKCDTESSLSCMEKVIGRDEDMRYLKEFLLQDDDDDDDEKVKANVSFIAIVGMGGIGKTTLAKALYNDKQVKDCFDPRIWIRVSYEFNTNTILSKIIESATIKESKLKGREALKTNLHELIEGKKYLLVMDDVWNEDEYEWKNLKNVLMVGARGSKVLITKRDSEEVARIKTVPLQYLPEDHAWMLFKEVAFKESDLHNSKLLQLGNEISKKCGGIPLLIGTIGSSLYGKNEQVWKSIKDNELLNITREQKKNGGNVLSTLKLSYNHLPPNLKQCFAYTSLFPKGYTITTNELIRQWVAQGFIESLNERKSMEDVGMEYLKELRRRFFYEIPSDNYYYFSNDIVSIHDLMRDLAKEVAGKELYVRGDSKNEYKVSERTRHISFDYKIDLWENVLTNLRQAKGLRTFILFSLHGEKNKMNETDLDKLFASFPRLRVLGLNSSGIHKVSESIKRLRHLRYLDVSENRYMKPVSNDCIIGLQNLQTLNIRPHPFDHNIKELPSEICNLVNLRHLVFSWDKKLFHVPEGLTKLSYLQTLSSFVFDCKNSNKLRETFSELSNKCFIESLSIRGLEALRSTPSDQLNSINLRNKKGFKYLTLKWEVIVETDHECKLGDEGCDETILEGLEPHPNVEALIIKGYCGVGLPNWVSTSSFNYLYAIEIKSCHRLQNLTQLGHLQALNYLLLKYLTSLVSLSEWIGTMTSLTVLNIDHCPKLKSLPEGLRRLKSLKQLYIKECPKLGMRCKKGGEDWPNISHIPEFSYESDKGYTTVSSFDDEDDEDDESDESDEGDEGDKNKEKMKDCTTNIRSLLLGTCGSTSSSGLRVRNK